MTPPVLSRRGLVALAVAAASVAASGCGGSPGGPHYTEIGIQTATTTGVEIESTCVPLPVLPGGTIERDIDLAVSLTAHVFVVRDYAEVTLEGTNDPAASHVQVSAQTLLTGYQQDLDVTTVDGHSYVVTLVSPCNAPPDPG